MSLATLGSVQLTRSVAVEVSAFRLSAEIAASDLSLLSPDERARGERFRFARDRAHFVSGRAELRRRLSGVVGADPRRIEFSYGVAGKPSCATSGLEFNLSHSDDLAVLAIAHGANVHLGIDVEVPRPNHDHLDELVARRFFAPGEVRGLLALPASERQAAFFRCWTRKEALLKALGGGLSLPLDDFEVTFKAGAPARIVRTSEPLARGAWTLFDLSSVDARCYAAVAVGTHEGVSLTITINPEGGGPS
jgi:4'-phosphopantetheinyl transferase